MKLNSSAGRAVFIVTLLGVSLIYLFAQQNQDRSDFIVYPLPTNKPLYKVAEQFAADFKKINETVLTIPAAPAFDLYTELNPRARELFNDSFGISANSDRAMSTVKISAELEKVRPTLDFRRYEKLKNGISVLARGGIALLLTYDAHRGIKLIDDSGKPVLIFLPVNFAAIRAFQYTPTGLEDRTYRHFCEDVELLDNLNFVERLPLMLGRGFNPETMDQLPDEQQALLVDFAAIYIAEVYNSIRGKGGRKEIRFSEALVRNTMFLPYLAKGGKILNFDQTDLPDAKAREEKINRTWATHAKCWAFFRGIRSRYQREITEKVISKYLQEKHQQLFDSIVQSGRRKSENVFEVIAAEFEQPAEVSGPVLASYGEFIRLMDSEAANISTAIEAAATIGSSRNVVSPENN